MSLYYWIKGALISPRVLKITPQDKNFCMSNVISNLLCPGKGFVQFYIYMESETNVERCRISCLFVNNTTIDGGLKRTDKLRMVQRGVNVYGITAYNLSGLFVALTAMGILDMLS